MADVSLPQVVVTEPAAAPAQTVVNLPQVSVVEPAAPSAQTIVGLPQVSVLDPAAQLVSVSVSLPQVLVTAGLRQVGVPLPTVAVRDALDPPPPGQLHRVAGVWRPFRVLRRSGTSWHDLGNGSVWPDP